jgi:hypothetical protein
VFQQTESFGVKHVDDRDTTPGSLVGSIWVGSTRDSIFMVRKTSKRAQQTQCAADKGFYFSSYLFAIESYSHSKFFFSNHTNTTSHLRHSQQFNFREDLHCVQQPTRIAFLETSSTQFVCVQAFDGFGKEQFRFFSGISPPAPII